MSFKSLPYNPPKQNKISIVYEDDYLLIVNKLAGLLTVPGKGIERQDCLIARVQLEIPEALIVHRLDMATSGLVLLAKSKAIQRALSILFQQGKVQKQYDAMVKNIPSEKIGVIDLPLRVDWPNRPLQIVNWINGKAARTYYQVCAIDYLNTCARLKVMPITGRAHQIRLHLMSIGHPILGDRLYAPKDVIALATRLMLHARSLEFMHPVNKHKISATTRPEF